MDPPGTGAEFGDAPPPRVEVWRCAGHQRGRVALNDEPLVVDASTSRGIHAVLRDDRPCNPQGLGAFRRKARSTQMMRLTLALTAVVVLWGCDSPTGPTDDDDLYYEDREYFEEYEEPDPVDTGDNSAGLPLDATIMVFTRGSVGDHGIDVVLTPIGTAERIRAPWPRGWDPTCSDPPGVEYVAWWSGRDPDRSYTLEVYFLTVGGYAVGGPDSVHSIWAERGCNVIELY